MDGFSRAMLNKQMVPNLWSWDLVEDSTDKWYLGLSKNGGLLRICCQFWVDNDDSKWDVGIPWFKHTHLHHICTFQTGSLLICWSKCLWQGHELGKWNGIIYPHHNHHDTPFCCTLLEKFISNCSSSKVGPCHISSHACWIMNFA